MRDEEDREPPIALATRAALRLKNGDDLAAKKKSASTVRYRTDHWGGRRANNATHQCQRRGQRSGFFRRCHREGTLNMNPVTAFLVFVCIVAGLAAGHWVNLYLASVFFAAAAIIAASLKMANVWQKFVILRMGKLQSVKGAGMFAIIPVISVARNEYG